MTESNSKGYSGIERRSCPFPDCDSGMLAAERAVERVFAILGIDIHNPKQVSDFQDTMRFATRLNKVMERSTFAFFAALAACLAGWIAYKFGFK